MGKLLVLGVGNILLRDDGVGVWAVQELMKEDWPENVEFADGGTATQDMFHILEGYDAVLVLDVVHSKKEPGTITLFREEELVQNEKQRLSLHDIDLLDSLEMADMLGKRPKVLVLGMEPLTYNDWLMELTEPCQAALPRFVEEARGLIRKYLESGF